jgi:hypothetical protein
MRMAKPEPRKPAPEAELRSCVSRFDPKHQKVFRSLRTAVRKRFPTANELAYDYGTHVVIAFAPTDRAIESILAIALRANGVQLYFNQGKTLPDPKKILLGKAQTRFVWIEAAKQLARPDIKALIAAASERAMVSFASRGKGTLTIRPTTASKRQGRKAKQ